MQECDKAAEELTAAGPGKCVALSSANISTAGACVRAVMWRVAAELTHADYSNMLAVVVRCRGSQEGGGGALVT